MEPQTQTMYQTRTGWYIANFGPPRDLYISVMEDDSTELGVLEFPPSIHRGRGFWTYATNGMSQRRMPCEAEPHGDPTIRFELLAYCYGQTPWVVTLLRELAAYPFLHCSGFAVGHTISVEADNQRWSGFLIGMPTN